MPLLSDRRCGIGSLARHRRCIPDCSLARHLLAYRQHASSCGHHRTHYLRGHLAQRHHPRPYARRSHHALRLQPDRGLAVLFIMRGSQRIAFGANAGGPGTLRPLFLRRPLEHSSSDGSFRARASVSQLHQAFGREAPDRPRSAGSLRWARSASQRLIHIVC